MSALAKRLDKLEPPLSAEDCNFTSAIMPAIDAPESEWVHYRQMIASPPARFMNIEFVSTDPSFEEIKQRRLRGGPLDADKSFNPPQDVEQHDETGSTSNDECKGLK